MAMPPGFEGGSQQLQGRRCARQAHGEGLQLDQVCCEQGFLRHPGDPLRQLAKHLGCVFEVTDDLLARVQKLVIHVLGFAILFSGTPNVHVYSLVSCMFVASSVARAIPHLEAPPPCIDPNALHKHRPTIWCNVAFAWRLRM